MLKLFKIQPCPESKACGLNLCNLLLPTQPPSYVLVEASMVLFNLVSPAPRTVPDIYLLNATVKYVWQKAKKN